MTQIRLDAHLAQQLQTAPAPLELCDPNGKIVGHFTPLTKARIEVPFSEDEIRQSKQEKGGRPLADILADLGKS
ncbi:MAG: hypothetical protein HY289_10720 [Planctomycetes bacterium]|nr:hypothetical protein [Planctomycetota bacterium]